GQGIGNLPQFPTRCRFPVVRHAKHHPQFAVFIAGPQFNGFSAGMTNAYRADVRGRDVHDGALKPAQTVIGNLDVALNQPDLAAVVTADIAPQPGRVLLTHNHPADAVARKANSHAAAVATSGGGNTQPGVPFGLAAAGLRAPGAGQISQQVVNAGKISLMVVLFAQPPALAVAVQTGNRFAAAAHNLQFIDIIDHISQPGHGCSRLVTAFITAPDPAGDEHQTNRSNHGQRQDSQCFSVHG